MDSLRVNVVYLSDVSSLSQNDLYVRRISHNAYPNISSGNSLLFLQIWFRERKGSWHTDVFSWCAYRRICCAYAIYRIFGIELGSLTLQIYIPTFLFLFLLLKSCPNSTMKYIFPQNSVFFRLIQPLITSLEPLTLFEFSLQKQRTNTLKITPKEPLLSPS